MLWEKWSTIEGEKCSCLMKDILCKDKNCHDWLSWWQFQVVCSKQLYCTFVWRCRRYLSFFVYLWFYNDFWRSSYILMRTLLDSLQKKLLLWFQIFWIHKTTVYLSANKAHEYFMLNLKKVSQLNFTLYDTNELIKSPFRQEKGYLALIEAKSQKLCACFVALIITKIANR